MKCAQSLETAFVKGIYKHIFWYGERRFSIRGHFPLGEFPVRREVSMG